MIPYDTAMDMGAVIGRTLAENLSKQRVYQYEQVVRWADVERLASEGWRMVHTTPGFGSGEDRWLPAFIMEKEVGEIWE